MNARTQIIEYLRDRCENYKEDADDLPELGIKVTAALDALAAGPLTDTDADILSDEFLNISTMDWIEEDRAMRRALNLLFHQIDRLERMDPGTTYWPGKPKTIKIDGIEYLAAV